MRHMLMLRLLSTVLGLALGLWASNAFELLRNDDATSQIINSVSLTLAGGGIGFLLGARVEPYAISGMHKFGVWYRNVEPRQVVAATIGLIVALLVSVLLTNLLSSTPLGHWAVSLAITAANAAFFVSYCLRQRAAFGALMGSSGVRKNINAKILDTNIVIDGRVLELAKFNFIEGDLIVPIFVLRELQMLADHSDPGRRTKGRRGMDILSELKTLRPLRIDEWDEMPEKPVDERLVFFAKKTGGKLITNDTGLAKVAHLHGVAVMSIHDAAVALRPVVQVGDELTVAITKPGQQSGQGVGFLEDGTMVIVEGGLRYRHKAVHVVVINNTQTAAGRMIFARLENNDAAEASFSPSEAPGPSEDNTEEKPKLSRKARKRLHAQQAQQASEAELRAAATPSE